MARERLRHEGDGVLLIFDNARDVEALRPWLPRDGACQVIVTSNAPNWGAVATPVAIRVWPKETGAQFLIERTARPESERAAAEALSEALGGLPLAHEMAASYCDRTGLSFAEYRRRFDEMPARLLDSDKDAPAEYHDRLTVAKTFALAIEEAAKLHSAAEPLIVLAALLAPEPIPLFVFREGLGTLFTGNSLDDAVAGLRAFALIECEAIPDERDPAITIETIRLHRLVREVATARLPRAARESALVSLIKAIVAVYPVDVGDDPTTWPRARRLDAVAFALVKDDSDIPGAARSEASVLLDRLASYRQHVLAAHTEARPLYELALALDEEVHGSEHPNTIVSLNNLARSLHDIGDLGAAHPLFERVLAASEKAFGTEDLRIAFAMNNLAAVLRDQGDLAGAKPLFQRALAFCENVAGAEHPATASALNNLAGVFVAADNLVAAQPLFERALAIREKALDPDHPLTAVSLGNLAGMVRIQGDFDRARPLYERALVICEKLFGPEDPRTNDVRRGLTALPTRGAT
jgi:tetratricopeptide (TPR) repeat protein